jgi:predicted Rdx family selenoprotein
VAALIKQEAGADTDLEPGNRGEFSVWVDGKKVAEKDHAGFPADTQLLQAVRSALA